jgi:tetratricopeptide (TPR) repeat protein
MPTSPIRIALLGPATILVRGATVQLSPRHLALASLFLLTKGSWLERGVVSRLLWPRSSAASGRHSLSQVVYSLQQALGQRFIRGTRDHIQMDRVSSDIEDFDHSLASANWRTAADLVRGPLLDGLELNSAEFEDWLDQQRESYRESTDRVIEALLLEDNGQYAADLALRLRIQAPVVGGTGELPATCQPKTSQFVGRGEEISKLERLYSLTKAAGFQAVIVEGEPGIGKTSLVDRFARIRVLRGDYPLIARGFAPEQNVPFGIAAQWIRGVEPVKLGSLQQPWQEILGSAFPGTIERNGIPPAETGPSGEFRVLEALRHLFIAISEERPLILVLDDALYSDAASVSLVHYLSRRASSAQILFVATIRSTTVSAGDPFDGWDNVQRIKVGPLTRPDTEALVQRLSSNKYSNWSPTTISGLIDRTGGNPLLLSLLLCSNLDQPLEDVPDSVAEFFTPRLRELSLAALKLMASVSIIGDNPSMPLATQVTGLSPADVQAAIRELESCGLVASQQPDSFSTRHGMVSEVAESYLPAVDRRVMYGRAARALSESGHSPSVVAVHHDIAGDKTRAFETAVSAAEASEALHATREREFFLKLALSNAPDHRAEAQIRIELAKLYQEQGKSDNGLSIINPACLTNAPLPLRNLARAYELQIRLSTVDPNRLPSEAFGEIRALEIDLDSEIVAGLYSTLAAAAHDLGQTQLTIAAAQRTIDIVRNSAATVRSAVFASRAALILGLYSGVEQGLALFDGLKPLIGSTIHSLCQCLPYEATLVLSSGRLLEAEQLFLQALELVERTCMYGGLFTIRNNLGACYLEQGRFDEAQRELEEALRVAGELTAPSNAAIASDNLGYLHYEQSRFELALRTVRDVQGPNIERSARSLFTRHALIGLCSLEFGQLAQAFESKREIDLLLTQYDYWSNDLSYVETFLSRMLVLEGKPERARARLETAIDVYRNRDMMCRARLELELGRLELKTSAGAALERAETMLQLLRGSGARPLIDRFEELADRARLRTA